MTSLLLLLGALSTSFALSGPREILIRFKVTLPRHFNTVSQAYLSGNDVALGEWEPKAVALVRAADGFYADVRVPAGTPLEYKVNLGDWLHTEVAASGKDIPNRAITCQQSCQVSIIVENIRLRAMHPVPQTAAANVYYHHDLYSKAFGNYRSLAVLLPAEYFKNPNKRYPVLYALDGNNLFDRVTSSTSHEEWGLDETLNRLFAKGELAPFIVVGIYNTAKRAEEYLSCRDPILNRGGDAEQYAQFIKTEIKPRIDRYYRTLPDAKNTSLMGSSFGGHFALFAARNFGETFSRFGAMSSAYWWGKHCLYQLLDRPFPHTPSRVWMDMGDREGYDDGAINFKNGVRELQEATRLLLDGNVIPAADLMSWVEKGGIHHERSWGARVAKMLHFLFGP